MEKTTTSHLIADYHSFVRDLKSQFNAVQVLEKSFFELEDLCEWSIVNGVTCLNDKNERVSVVDETLGRQQNEMYEKLCKAVKDLHCMLSSGVSCFNKQ